MLPEEEKAILRAMKESMATAHSAGGGQSGGTTSRANEGRATGRYDNAMMQQAFALETARDGVAGEDDEFMDYRRRARQTHTGGSRPATATETAALWGSPVASVSASTRGEQQQQQQQQPPPRQAKLSSGLASTPHPPRPSVRASKLPRDGGRSSTLRGVSGGDRMFPTAQVPVFYPSRADFADPAAYIAKLQSYGDRFGMVKIVPPLEFRPPFAVLQQVAKVASVTQPVHQLMCRTGANVDYLDCLRFFLSERNIQLRTPHIQKRPIDLPLLARLVSNAGGMSAVSDQGKWGEIADLMHLPHASKRDEKLCEIYVDHLLQFDHLSTAEHMRLRQRVRDIDPADSTRLGMSRHLGSFAFTPRSSSTMKAFQSDAESLQAAWIADRTMTDAAYEQEFWRLVEEREEAFYAPVASNIDTLQVGSGFSRRALPMSERETVAASSLDGISRAINPQRVAEARRALEDDAAAYADSPWNLNVLPRLPSGLLAYLPEKLLPVVTAPWLDCGALFGATPWQVEDQGLYTVHYMHYGSNQRWYSVPCSQADAFEEAMREIVPELFDAMPDLLQRRLTMVSPGLLQRHGVPVYTTVQTAGEYIVTFPRVYRAGFSQGPNCIETSVFAPAEWIPHGINSMYLNCEHTLRNAFSVQELVTRAARECTDPHTCRILRDAMDELIEEEDAMRARAGQLQILKFFSINNSDKKQRPPQIVTNDVSSDSDGNTSDTPDASLPVASGAASRGGEPSSQEADGSSVTQRNRLRGALRTRHMTRRSASRTGSLVTSSAVACCVCKSLGYWSFVVCSCTPTRATCIMHSFDNCECAAEQKTLWYRYLVDDLQTLRNRVGALAEEEPVRTPEVVKKADEGAKETEENGNDTEKKEEEGATPMETDEGVKKEGDTAVSDDVKGKGPKKSAPSVGAAAASAAAASSVPTTAASAAAASSVPTTMVNHNGVEPLLAPRESPLVRPVALGDAKVDSFTSNGQAVVVKSFSASTPVT